MADETDGPPEGFDEALRKLAEWRSPTYFWGVGHGSASSLFWISRYGYDPEPWWHRYLFVPVFEAAYKLDRAAWWLRYRLHPKHRYHVVGTGLEPGYHDNDTRMLYACFALLVEYVEIEHGGAEALRKHVFDSRANPDPNAPDEWNEAASLNADDKERILELYHWWKVERPALEERISQTLTEGYSGEIQTVKLESGMYELVMDEPSPEIESIRKLHNELERKLREDTQKKLHELIDVRERLWT
jgi:hypothetical protein